MKINDLKISNSFKMTKMVVISKEKSIKEVLEIEKYDNDFVLYMTDGTSYGISQCESVEKTFNKENGKIKV
jgi:hypothetical protein